MTEPEDPELAIARAELEAARAAARLADAELRVARALHPAAPAPTDEAPVTDQTTSPTAPETTSSPQPPTEPALPETPDTTTDADEPHHDITLRAEPATELEPEPETDERPAAPEATPDAMAEVMPDVTPDLTPAVAPDATPDEVAAAVPASTTQTSSTDDAVPTAPPGGEVVTHLVASPAEETTDADAADPDHEPTRDDDARSPRRAWAIAAVFVVVALVAAGIFVYATRDKGLPSDAALRADGVTISEDELARRTQVLVVLYGVQIPSNPDDLDTFRRATAHAVALSEVLARAAKDKGVVVSSSDITTAIDGFIKQQYATGGKAAFDKDLTAAGISETDVQQELSRQLAEQRLFDKVTAKVTVTDAQVQAAYQQNPSAYAVPETRQIRHIVVADSQAGQQVLANLKRGVPFTTEVKRASLDGSTSSTGGELGVLQASQLEQSFATAAFSAPAGGFFGPVQTRFGWDVGQVEKVNPAQPKTFSQAESQVRDKLVADQSLVVWRSFLTNLEKHADITYADAYKPPPGSDSTNLPGTGLPTSNATPTPSSSP